MHLWHRPFPELKGCCRRDVDVVQFGREALLLKDVFNQRHGHGRRSLKVCVRVVLERDREAWDTKEGTFDGGGYGSGVEDIDSRIESAIDTADNQVDRFGSEFRNAEFDAVGW